MANVSIDDVVELGNKHEVSLIQFQSEPMQAKGIIMFGSNSRHEAKDFAEAVQEKLGLNSWWRESTNDGGSPYLTFVTKTPSDLVF